MTLTVPHQAGTGGDALSRGGVFQEPVFAMNWMYPYWFAERFLSYNYRVRKLPIDQHELIALIAPRTLFVTAAKGYPWAGYRTSLRAMAAAEPVYRLYGATGRIATGVITDADVASNANIGGLTQYRKT